MKNILYLYLFLIFSSAFAQKGTLKGMVLFEKFPLENVNVSNLATSILATTDVTGEFSLFVKLGDTLQLNFLGMETIKRVVDQRDFELAKMTFNMIMASSKLDEVKINTIDAVSLRIIPKKVKPLTVNERKFASESKINSIDLIKLGFRLELVPILNAINGRTKELKNNIKIEKKEAMITHLKTNYSDYLLSKLKLTEGEKLVQFYYYLVDLKGIENEVYNQNTAQVNFYLFNKYMEFQELNKDAAAKL